MPAGAILLEIPAGGLDVHDDGTKEDPAAAAPRELEEETGLRAATWLRENPGDPASNLPHDDDELVGLITELVMLSRDQPSSHESMELNFLLLEQRRLEDELAAAAERGDYERRAALSRERATLVERIARTQRVES